MHKFYRAPQQGIAHLGLILIAVVVLGGIGFAGYKVFTGKQSPAESAMDSAARKAAEQACTETDKTICKFLASWKVQKYYTVHTKGSPADKATYEATYKVEGEDKFHMTTTGESAIEMIIIGKDTYTKAANGTWWKQTNKPEVADGIKPDNDFGADDSTVDDTTETKSTTTYKALGKEACGNLNCFKYQVIDSADTDTTEYIWFDDEDYQLRRNRTESQGGYDDSTYSYDKITISVPSPVKELGPNQFLVPGQSEPTTMPDAGSYQDYLNSLPQGSDEEVSAEE